MIFTNKSFTEVCKSKIYMKKHNDLPKCIKVWKILKLTNIFNINEQRSQKYGFIVYDWILISVAQDVTHSKI